MERQVPVNKLITLSNYCVEAVVPILKALPYDSRNILYLFSCLFCVHNWNQKLLYHDVQKIRCKSIHTALIIVYLRGDSLDGIQCHIMYMLIANQFSISSNNNVFLKKNGKFFISQKK